MQIISFYKEIKHIADFLVVSVKLVMGACERTRSGCAADAPINEQCALAHCEVQASQLLLTSCLARAFF